jgi:hypothetical protein
VRRRAVKLDRLDRRLDVDIAPVVVIGNLVIDPIATSRGGGARSGRTTRIRTTTTASTIESGCADNFGIALHLEGGLSSTRCFAMINVDDICGMA